MQHSTQQQKLHKILLRRKSTTIHVYIRKRKTSQIHNLILSLDAYPMMTADIEKKLQEIQKTLVAIEFR
jgi:Tfp pilus assembly pilus retraction ATPase PilT